MRALGASRAQVLAAQRAEFAVARAVAGTSRRLGRDGDRLGARDAGFRARLHLEPLGVARRTRARARVRRAERLGRRTRRPQPPADGGAARGLIPRHALSPARHPSARRADRRHPRARPRLRRASGTRRSSSSRRRRSGWSSRPAARAAPTSGSARPTARSRALRHRGRGAAVGRRGREPRLAPRPREGARRRVHAGRHRRRRGQPGARFARQHLFRAAVGVLPRQRGRARQPRPAQGQADRGRRRRAAGTRKLGLDLLEASGAATAPTQLLPLGGLAAVEALKAGKVDAIFLVGSANTGAVWVSLLHPGLPADEPRARRRVRAPLAVPVEARAAARGDRPRARHPGRATSTLVAPVASLVAREEIHPALIDVLLQTATEVHGPPGLFQRAGEFPNARQADFPISGEAQRFYQSGRRFLQRYLPFWAATLIDRMLVLLIPLFALAIPLSRILPSLYGLAGPLADLQVVRPAQVPRGGVAARSGRAAARRVAEGARRARGARQPHPHPARVREPVLHPARAHRAGAAEHAARGRGACGARRGAGEEAAG